MGAFVIYVTFEQALVDGLSSLLANLLEQFKSGALFIFLAISLMSQRISILPFTSYPSLFFYLFIEDCVKLSRENMYVRLRFLEVIVRSARIYTL